MKNRYMNPYLAGFLLGLLIIISYYISGEGLGSSGGYRDVAVATIDKISHSYALSNEFTAPRVTGPHSPAHSFLVYLLLGVIFGSILSSVLYGRLKFMIGKAPHISNKRRLYLALIGGILWGIGTQIGHGCTSGLVLSGLAVNSLSGYIGLVAIFGAGFIFALIFRRIWLKPSKK